MTRFALIYGKPVTFFLTEYTAASYVPIGSGNKQLEQEITSSLAILLFICPSSSLTSRQIVANLIALSAV